MNTELFQKILEKVEAEPEDFNMDAWESRVSNCGTTRCIAGWAIYLETGQPLYSGYDHSPGLFSLAERLGIGPYGVRVSDVGRKLLGLSEDQEEMFYLGDEDALQALRLAAAGDGDALDAFLAERAGDDE